MTEETTVVSESDDVSDIEEESGFDDAFGDLEGGSDEGLSDSDNIAEEEGASSGLEEGSDDDGTVSETEKSEEEPPEEATEKPGEAFREAEEIGKQILGESQKQAPPTPPPPQQSSQQPVVPPPPPAPPKQEGPSLFDLEKASQWESDYPESTDYVAKAAVDTYKKLVDARQAPGMDDLKMVAQAAIDLHENSKKSEEAIGALSDRLEQAMFVIEMLTTDSEAISLARTDDYKNWVSKQPDALQALNRTRNIKGALSLMKAYREFQAGREAAKHDEKAKKKATHTDKLLKGSIGQGSVSNAGISGVANNEDYDGAFEEALGALS